MKFFFLRDLFLYTVSEMVAQAYNPRTWQKQVDLSEFKAILEVYIEGAKPAGAM